MLAISLEIKDVVFDYFNIIAKEYEMGLEKWKDDNEYKEQINEIKKSIDAEFIERKYEVPALLTREKA